MEKPSVNQPLGEQQEENECSENKGKTLSTVAKLLVENVPLARTLGNNRHCAWQRWQEASSSTSSMTFGL